MLKCRSKGLVRVSTRFVSVQCTPYFDLDSNTMNNLLNLKSSRRPVDRDKLIRIKEYDKNFSRIRTIVLDHLDKEQKKRLFGNKITEASFGARDLVLLYVHEYLREKFPGEDTEAIALSGTKYPTGNVSI